MVDDLPEGLVLFFDGFDGLQPLVGGFTGNEVIGLQGHRVVGELFMAHCEQFFF